MVREDDGVMVLRGLGRRLGELDAPRWRERHPPRAPEIEPVVQGGEPDPLTEQVDKQDMLRVQVDHGLDIGTHGIRAGVQAPLDRGARTAAVFAAEGQFREVPRSKPVQPGARGGDEHRVRAGHPDTEVATAGEDEAPLDDEPPGVHELFEEVTPERRVGHQPIVPYAAPVGRERRWGTMALARMKGPAAGVDPSRQGAPMGILDRLFGRPEQPARPWQNAGNACEQPRAHGRGAEASEDERAVARYRYLLRTATPEQIEAVHAEAFAQLTAEQRRQLLQQLGESLPPGERATSAEPADLARAATRAEMRQPGYLPRTLSGGSFAGAGGLSMGRVIGGSMLGTVAGMMIGSAMASILFQGYDSSPEAAAVGEASGVGEGAEPSDTGGNESAESGGWGEASGAGDSGGWGDSGGGFGDIGGGDIGGGDFGGGDFGF